MIVRENIMNDVEYSNSIYCFQISIFFEDHTRFKYTYNFMYTPSQRVNGQKWQDILQFSRLFSIQ